jgi:hypothetical protein
MCVNLETLELTSEQQCEARDQVRQRAYELWEEAGRPPGDGVEFWLAAEEEWIGHDYVPPRPLEWNDDDAADVLVQFARA